MRHHCILALSSVFLATAAVPSVAQNIVPLVLEGDVIPGVGNVTFIDNIAVNNAGEWMVEVRTNNSNTAMNQVTLKNGLVVLSEGQSLPAPSGATLRKFDSLTLSAQGDSATNLELNGVPMNSDIGIFWNDKLVIQAGDTSSASAFGPNTIYKGFLEVTINDANQMLVLAEMDDPAVTTGNEQAMVVLDLDASGNLLGETVVVKVGDLFNGMFIGFPILTFGTNPHYISFNDSGQAMFRVSLNAGNAGVDEGIMLGTTILAEESAPSVIPGRNWSSMGTPELSVNNLGDWVFSVTIDGSGADDLLITRNNQKFQQEADPVPGMPQWSIESFGSGPVEISDNGNLVWFCDWDDTNTAIDQGIFINNTLTVQEGVSMVGTHVMTKLTGLIDGYHLSPQGNYLIFEGELDNGNSGAFLLSLSGAGGTQPGSPTCFGDGSGAGCPCGNVGATGSGCANSSGGGGVLDASGSASLNLGDAAFFGTSLPGNRMALLVTGNNPSSNLFGDGLLCVGTPWTGMGARVTNSAGSASWSAGVLASGNFSVGQTSYFQILFRDPTGPCSSGFGASSAYQITFVQ